MGSGATGSGSVLKCEQGGMLLGVGLYISVFLPPPASIQCHLEDPLEIPIPIQIPGMGTTVCKG